jgi:hypothetical protein
LCLKYLKKKLKCAWLLRDSKLIIDGYLECLCSSDPEIVMSAAKVLSEISILAAGQWVTGGGGGGGKGGKTRTSQFPPPGRGSNSTNKVTYIILEYSDELLEKAFAATTKKLGNIGPHVTKTFQMFNLE